MNQDKRTLDRAKWQELIETQEKSGLSQKAFCQQHRLVLSQFAYYRGQIKNNKGKKIINTDDFVSVKLNKNETTVSSEIRIILPNGFQCYLPSGLDVLQVKRLMEVLLSC